MQPVLKGRSNRFEISFLVIIVVSASAFSCEELLSFQIILDWHLVERNQPCSSRLPWQHWATPSADVFFPLVPFVFYGVTGETLVHLGSALFFWGQNSTKPRLKDKPSQTTNQCWLFLLSAVVLCLGRGRGMASLVSAPAHREEHRLLKEKGRKMCHLAQSREKKSSLKDSGGYHTNYCWKVYTGQNGQNQVRAFSQNICSIRYLQS